MPAGDMGQPFWSYVRPSWPYRQMSKVGRTGDGVPCSMSQKPSAPRMSAAARPSPAVAPQPELHRHYRREARGCLGDGPRGRSPIRWADPCPPWQSETVKLISLFRLAIERSVPFGSTGATPVHATNHPGDGQGHPVVSCQTGPLTLPLSRRPARLALLRTAGGPILAAPASASLEAALDRLCAPT